jgi:hypothetical protein
MDSSWALSSDETELLIEKTLTLTSEVEDLRNTVRTLKSELYTRTSELEVLQRKQSISLNQQYQTPVHLRDLDNVSTISSNAGGGTDNDTDPADGQQGVLQAVVGVGTSLTAVVGAVVNVGATVGSKVITNTQSSLTVNTNANSADTNSNTNKPNSLTKTLTKAGSGIGAMFGLVAAANDDDDNDGNLQVSDDNTITGNSAAHKGTSKRGKHGRANNDGDSKKTKDDDDNSLYVDSSSDFSDINSETQARHHESEHNKNKGSNGSVNANTSNSKPQQPPMNAWVSVDDENEDESWGFTSPSANAQTPSGGANRTTPSSVAGTPSGKPPVNTQDFGSADSIKSPPSMRKKGALSARASLVPKESPHGSNSARGGLVPISGSLDNFDDLLSFGVADDAGKFST